MFAEELESACDSSKPKYPGLVPLSFTGFTSQAEFVETARLFAKIGLTGQLISRGYRPTKSILVVPDGKKETLIKYDNRERYLEIQELTGTQLAKETCDGWRTAIHIVIEPGFDVIPVLNQLGKTGADIPVCSYVQVNSQGFVTPDACRAIVNLGFTPIVQFHEDFDFMKDRRQTAALRPDSASEIANRTIKLYPKECIYLLDFSRGKGKSINMQSFLAKVGKVISSNGGKVMFAGGLGDVDCYETLQEIMVQFPKSERKNWRSPGFCAESKLRELTSDGRTRMSARLCGKFATFVKLAHDSNPVVFERAINE